MVYTQTETRGPVKFFFGRVKRIVPLYLIISIPLILMHVKITDFFPLLSNILLFPSFGQYHHGLANPPAWTLVYEMIFYVFFALSLFVSKNNVKSCFISVTIIVSILAITTYKIGIEPRYGWIHLGYILGDTLMLDFAAGCVLAILHQKLGIKAFISFRVFVAIVIFITYIALNVINDVRIYKFGIPAMVMIAIAIYTKEGEGVIYRILHVIGDASYSIYLSHIYFSFAVKAAISTNHPNIEQAQFAVLLITVASVLTGVFINKTIEKPVIYFFAKKIKKANPPSQVYSNNSV